MIELLYSPGLLLPLVLHESILLLPSGFPLVLGKIFAGLFLILEEFKDEMLAFGTDGTVLPLFMGLSADGSSSGFTPGLPDAVFF